MFNLTEKELEQKDALNTTKEIKQQPELWKETLANYKAKKNDIDAFIDNIKKNHERLRVIFTGAGTSAYVGETVTPYLGKNIRIRLSK